MRGMQILILAWLLFSGALIAQNAAPVISNLVVSHNTASRSVTLNFDLSDAENDPLEVHFRVSGDGGRTFLITQLDSVTGDIGYPVTPGPGKSITWHYSLNSLANDGLLGPSSLQLRVIADDRVPIDIQNIVDQVDSARVVNTLKYLEGIRHRTANPSHLQAVRDSIRNLMAVSGLQDWHHDWTFFGYNAENYIGRRGGLTGERRTWYISGHYDSVNDAPGADDNGTATAAVMEAVRLLSAYEFHHSIRFCAFDLEEAGLVGSILYVTTRIPDWEEVGGLLNMEMIGYYDDSPNSQSFPNGFDQLFPAAYQQVSADSFRGNFLTNVANVASDSLRLAFDSCAAAFVPDLRVISIAAPGNALIAPDLRRSDHAPFWDAGFQALMLTDAANLRNPYYHTPADSVGTLDMGFYVRNVKAVIGTLAKLAKPLHATYSDDTIQVDVPVGVVTSRPRLRLDVFPNPSQDAFNIEFELAGASTVQMVILNAQGKLLRLLSDEPWPAGSHRLVWDGKTESGAPVASGNYWLVMRSDEGPSVRPLRLMR